MQLRNIIKNWDLLYNFKKPEDGLIRAETCGCDNAFFLNEQLFCLTDTYWFLHSTLQQATTSFRHTTSITLRLITRHQTTPFIDIVANSTD